MALIIVVVVVVVLLIVSIVAVALLTAPAPAPAIQVGEIDIWAPDNVCGLNTNPIAYYGYNGSTGEQVSIEFTVPNYNVTACTLHSVITNSTGFVLSGVHLPPSIPGNGTAPLNLTVTSPASSFSGSLNLVFS